MNWLDHLMLAFIFGYTVGKLIALLIPPKSR
jgi:hypothetical protein